MGSFTGRVFIVQQADEEGRLDPTPLAVKMNFTAAQAIAKRYAPAKVTAIIADKTLVPNGPGQAGYQGQMHLIAQDD